MTLLGAIFYLNKHREINKIKEKQGNLSPKDQVKQEIKNKPSHITQQITYTNTQTFGIKNLLPGEM